MEEQTQDPAFWNDIEKSSVVLQKSKNLKQKVEGFEELEKQWEDTLMMTDMAIEEKDESLYGELSEAAGKLEENISAMKLDALLNGPYDKNNAIISLHAGAGGTEAQDWVEMLMRMYVRWAERRGFKTETLDYLAGDEAGVKSVTCLLYTSSKKQIQNSSDNREQGKH